MNKEQLFAEICAGNVQAFEFINLWLKHAHFVDDIIDKEVPQQDIVRSYVEAQYLFTHPFFLEHRDRLYSLHILSAVAYVNSNDLELTHEKLSDSLRSFGSHLLVLVAGICAPEGEPVFDRMCRLGLEIHKQSWSLHHDENNKPI